MEWWKDLCEYYNVSKEQAIELGIRKAGRRPDFPASNTCPAVGGKNMDEWWDSSPRETLQQKMDFYKDIGAWLTFRQCNYRSNFNYEAFFGSDIRNGCNIVEYGCGVAPFTNYIVENKEKLNVDLSTLKFVLVDVVSEPLEFAKWRLNKKVSDINLEIHGITEEYPLPKFSDQFDIICIMDVFEHLPNPYAVVDNLSKHASPGCLLVETWVDKSGGQAGGCDLEEAELERPKTEKLLNEVFPVFKRGSIRCRRKSEG